ncbi:glycoside hydrolase family 53 protein [Enterococcus mundtii]|uniref:Arabinogalactan endo-beta-1,4-galactanase n=1 Tax=Enterococcus mundtii TaxID=53346 RepID=A0ABQ0VBV4_ENTMU|nr:glycosyl hydrolase 53 family protein [Enterococcus mundtii]GEN17464.1 arabinogalactan endo-beta-1,4-galactanase [Ligilactobacillus acidipiscis]AUB52877.1 beta-1,4-galactanase [Enterococcus mundtii]MZZ58659.1 cellulase family glycosylhydrolase [Enterococcus mundtii]MZZ61452.1 cellulase family glycosylhydrolase [Enterococcus mundtii]MZZ68619.1 cellulase family glycosylhydrolase [Enterococcus mundtii]
MNKVKGWRVLVVGLFVSLVSVALGTKQVEAKELIRGADISILADMEKSGAGYYENGVKKDALQILKNNGVNYVRLRLWQDPYDDQGNSYGAGTNDLNTTIALAKRAKNLGLKVLLDFHYSDFWVDPGKQNLPKAWENYSFEQLDAALYGYTKSVLTEMKNNGVYPDMVQIGNELNSGMLWPYGKSWGEGGGEFDRLATFLKSGIRGVKETQPVDTPIMLHLADGGDTDVFTWWFDEITKRGVDYDLIGLSYYPYWHGSMNALQTTMNTISARYDKEVNVVETAYGHTTANADSMPNAFGPEQEIAGGYAATPAGQREYLNDLVTRIQTVPNEKGNGFFYWEPLWYNGNVSWATAAGMNYLGVQSQTGNEWDNQAMFDFNGQALPSLKAFQEAGRQQNILKNPSFENDGFTNTPANWSVWRGNGAAIDTLKTETGGFSGAYKATFWDDQAYQMSIYQTVNGLSKGTYTLTAYTMAGGDLTASQMYVKNHGGKELKASITKSGEWTKVTIKDIPVTSGTSEIGIYVDAKAQGWVSVDHVTFVKNQ